MYTVHKVILKKLKIMFLLFYLVAMSINATQNKMKVENLKWLETPNDSFIYLKQNDLNLIFRVDFFFKISQFTIWAGNKIFLTIISIINKNFCFLKPYQKKF